MSCFYRPVTSEPRSDESPRDAGEGETEPDPGPNSDDASAGGGGHGGDATLSTDAQLKKDAAWLDAPAVTCRPDGVVPSIPLRLVFFYTPHGFDEESSRISGSETTFSLPSGLRPLENLKSSMVVLSGLTNTTDFPLKTPARTHVDAVPSLLTGGVVNGRSSSPILGGGPSLDWLYATSMAGGCDAGLRLMALGVQTGVDEASLVSYRAAGSPIVPKAIPDGLDVSAPGSDYRVIGEKHLANIVEAFRNDRARVATISWGNVQSQMRFEWLGLTRSFHEIAEGSDGESKEGMAKIQAWHASKVAWLAEELSKIPERDGKTLLHHSLIVWLSETGVEGFRHSGDNGTIVLVGNMGGRIKTGRWINASGHQVFDLLQGIAATMNLKAAPPFNQTGILWGRLGA